MRAYQIAPGSTGLEGLKRGDAPEPELGPYDVKVRVRATSLNYRDQAVVKGAYFGGPVKAPQIPLSDGAGEVVAVGASVTRFKVGDRAAGTFVQRWNDGPPPLAILPALGAAPATGTLAELLVLHEDGFVRVPANLSFEEAATLPCAGVTAWNALNVVRRVKPGETVLVLGTGGVSLLATQFARAAGARVVATSSSDAKLERVKALGAEITINYKTTPAWGQAVLDATGGWGADFVVEVGGPGTMEQSMIAVAPGGTIALIGVLTGTQGWPSPHGLARKRASLRGVFVGSRAMFEEMNKAIEVNRIQPVIDKTFGFDDAVEAYRYQASDKLFGKVVIKV
jgi:NADPH:quinone reductase-like Zn-dependent oxidoreductase